MHEKIIKKIINMFHDVIKSDCVYAGNTCKCSRRSGGHDL